MKGEKFVPMEDIERLASVVSTCVWRGHSFKVGIIVGASANVIYLGKEFDVVSDLPGMHRPDKYEVQGHIPVSELTGLEEWVEEIPLDGVCDPFKQKRDR
ncbi:hypothetical protein H7H51_05165 [Mycolicibacterium farcinogenes]|nr:hypothetical protein [Mycolicibacterium farcinogenes]